MSWRDFFKSSHTLYLEKEVADLKARHDREIADLRSSFQKQLDDATNYNQRLRDELERTRILLSPGLSSVSLPHENDESTPPAEVFKIPTGTPWQRTLAKETQMEFERGKAREAQQQADRAKGVTDGNERPGWNSAPQREPSAPS